jgi:hypothetical protein
VTFLAHVPSHFSARTPFIVSSNQRVRLRNGSLKEWFCGYTFVKFGLKVLLAKSNLTSLFEVNVHRIKFMPIWDGFKLSWFESAIFEFLVASGHELYSRQSFISLFFRTECSYHEINVHIWVIQVILLRHIPILFIFLLDSSCWSWFRVKSG